jgi:hypothetical protein
MTRRSDRYATEWFARAAAKSAATLSRIDRRISIGAMSGGNHLRSGGYQTLFPHTLNGP